MADSIWNALCKPPTVKASSKKYAQLVHDSTTQLHQSLEPILSALDRRAIGLTKCANFESALHDAKAIQQLSPSSALGYIREAEIYSEQGKQRQAIGTCNKGLGMVDSMDTQYATLQQAKMDAEQRQNTRIDFISQLPLDIVITTLIPLFLYDYHFLRSSKPIPYLHVSNVWQDRIIQWLDGLEIDIDDEDANLLHIIPLARHITTLEVHRFSKGTWLGDLLRNSDFCSLRELSIGAFSADCVDHLISSLKSIGGTLTNLRIEEDYGTMLPIEEILVNCPNLVYLDISQPFPADIRSLSMTTWPKITTLILFSNAGHMTTRDDIIPIAKRFPSLKKLQFFPCEDMEAMRVVMDYYPWMNNLEIYEFEVGFNTVFSEDGPRRQERAITNLTIDMHAIEIDRWESALHVLRQHQQTLEDISLEADVPSVNEEIYNIEYPCLKKLCIRNSGMWIPRNAPMLEEMKISCFTFGEESTVPDALPPKLKKLELDLDHGYHRVDKAPYAQYVHRYARHPHLKELVVHLHSSDTIVNVLEAILHLGQLERLMIRFTDDWDTTQMQGYIDALVKGCPNVSSLGISCNNAPSTYSMNALKRLEHLEQFGFSLKDVDDHDGFWHAIQAFPQLKSIHIYPFNSINMHHLARLQQRRPGLKIVVDHNFTYVW